MIPVGYQPHGTAENDAKLGSLPRSPKLVAWHYLRHRGYSRRTRRSLDWGKAPSILDLDALHGPDDLHWRPNVERSENQAGGGKPLYLSSGPRWSATATLALFCQVAFRGRNDRRAFRHLRRWRWISRRTSTLAGDGYAHRAGSRDIPCLHRAYQRLRVLLKFSRDS
jgi:hypothetical protein